MPDYVHERNYCTTDKKNREVKECSNCQQMWKNKATTTGKRAGESHHRRNAWVSLLLYDNRGISISQTLVNPCRKKRNFPPALFSMNDAACACMRACGQSFRA